MNRYVQGIIIKNSNVLMGLRRDVNPSQGNFFLNGEVFEGEEPHSALKRIVSNKLGLSCEILLKLNSESYNNMSTFLIEVTDLKLEDNLEDKGFRWMPLYDRESFSYNEKLQLANLLDTCFQEAYQPNWLKPLEEIVLSDNRLRYSREYIFNKRRTLEHREIDSGVSSSHKFSMIALSLLTGIVYDSFFTEWKFGISVPIFAAIITLIFFYSSKGYIKKVSLTGVLMLVLSLCLSLNFAVHSNEFLMMVNTLALPILLTGSYIALRYGEISWNIGSFISRVLGRLFTQSGENFLKPFKFIRTNMINTNGGKLSPVHKSVLIGLAISLPLLLIIVPLLSSADSVFSYYISNASNIFEGLKFGNLLFDLIVISFVTLYSFGFYWSFKYENVKNSVERKKKGMLEPITVLTVLIVINVVYLLFTIVQASYLYGGAKTALPNGFTYAEYARRGFFELVMVTVINFTILVLSRRFTKNENPTINKVLSGVYTVLVIFTLNMLYSANFKMSLYESAFGYTYLRVYVQLFLILLLLLFAIALAGIWFNRVQTSRMSIIAVLVMYLVVNYVNVDAIIARKNIERFETSGKIDSIYLTGLSDDAVPELVKLVESSNATTEVKNIIGQNLDFRGKRLDAERVWYELNYSRYKAMKAINRSE